MTKILLSTLLIFSVSVMAYEQPTHMNMSESALKLSVIAEDSTVLSDFGLKGFSQAKFQDPNIVSSVKEITITDLVRNGANFEDNFTRSLAHFYDPRNDIGLLTSNKSPDWALEDIADVNSGVDGTQEYSYKDGMQYFYLALTSKAEQDRSKNWGKTFQTLGQVIHHVQDMAQPEHVRNDAHLIGVDESRYEIYSGEKFGTNAGITGITLDYPIPTFDTARKFWTTREPAGTGDVTARDGMADFTNRNFVSEDSNFRVDANNQLTYVDNNLPIDYNLPLPGQVTTRDLADVSVMGTAGQVACDKLKQNSSIIFPVGGCVIDFIGSSVTDSYINQTATNERAATRSIFNKNLTDNGLLVAIHADDGDYEARGIFTLNQFNFDAAHNYLIPRAVSYSAGFINHFFRGKIDMKPNPGGAGYVIKNLSDEDMQGTFVLYYDHKNAGSQEKLRDPIPGATWNLTIAANSEVAVGSYTVPAGALSKTLVFSGRIGAENNVHAGKHFGGWSGPMLGLVLANANISSIQVANDDSGNAMLLYAVFNSSSYSTDLWARRYLEGTGWGEATLISNNYSYSSSSLAMDSNGNALVIYGTYNTGNNGYRKLWSKYFIPATNWGDPTLISGGSTSISTGNLVMNASGDALMVYTSCDSIPDSAGFSCSLWSRYFTPTARWASGIQLTDYYGYNNFYSNNRWFSNYLNYYLVKDINDNPVFISHKCTRTGSIENHALLSQGYQSSVFNSAVVIDALPVLNDSYASDLNQYTGEHTADSCYYSPLTYYPVNNLIDYSGYLNLLYTRHDTSNYTYEMKRYMPNGSWGAATPYTVNAATPFRDTYYSQFDVDTDGNAIAVNAAAGGANGHHIVAHHAVPGVGWGDEVELSPVNGSPMIDVSPDGHAAVVWLQQGANGYELWSNHYTP